MPMLVRSWSLQYLQHFLHTRGVVVPVKGEASSFALDHLNVGGALLDFWVPGIRNVLKNRPCTLFL